jgi:hypothetical protein
MGPIGAKMFLRRMNPVEGNAGVVMWKLLVESKSTQSLPCPMQYEGERELSRGIPLKAVIPV